MFKRGKYRKYNHSSYSKRKSFKHVRWDRFLLIAGAVIFVVGLVVTLNFNRIRLLLKGYGLKESSAILKLTKEEENLIISYPRLISVTTWLEASDQVDLYDEYDRYYQLHEDMEPSEIITLVDAVFPQHYDSLIDLGYTDEQIWSMLDTATVDDLVYVIGKEYKFSDFENYYKIPYFQFTKVDQYISKYKEVNSYNYAVNAINFPQIISSNHSSLVFEIKNTDSITLLIKKGFKYPVGYEPADLVVPNIPNSPTNENNKVRQVVATALEKMVNDAASQGKYLVLNHGYRSYAQQVEIFEHYKKMYGGQYANEYVATPGSSEHQTGLSIDLTSQSVVDKEKITFGDTVEFKWVLENAHHYGFILRYPENKKDITGINSEPWHLRYIGEDVAKAVYESGLTYEEYCLYNSIIPEVDYK